MITTEYKVFIPSAGLGTRLGDLGKNINKALVAVDNKPGISHIIDKFPKEVEIVVAVGHLGHLISQYLEQTYPDRKITIVKIENYEGPGSGLGRTILDCQEHLQCPFIFCSNDTIVREDIPPPNANWLGWSRRDDCSMYRTLEIDGDRVIQVLEKKETRSNCVYIGLAGIKDYRKFWSAMESGINKGSIETGEAYGINHLIDAQDVGHRCFEWYDTGNPEEFKRANAVLGKSDVNILPKPDEAIWFANDRVVKYSADEDFIAHRVERANALRGFVPEIISCSENMYSYRMVRGKVLSKVITQPVFEDFLRFLRRFWSCCEVEDYRDFKKGCLLFYRDKTQKRVEKYFHRFGEPDRSDVINGVKTPSLADLFNELDWGWLAAGLPVRFHGDLHFENVLVSEDYHFMLLDWRQDFAGQLDCGDLYYDLAKLLHGMIVSHEVVSKDLFSIDVDAGVVSFDIMRSHRVVEIQDLFKRFVQDSGYDWKKVKILTALIYLNIAPLHHYPYAELLFYLGKSMLAGELNGIKQC